MKIKEGFVLRKVGERSVVVPVGEMSKEFHGMITLNGTAAFLWEYFQEEHTLEEATDALYDEYCVDYDYARDDVAAFARKLVENNFAEDENSGSSAPEEKAGPSKKKNGKTSKCPKK